MKAITRISIFVMLIVGLVVGCSVIKQNEENYMDRFSEIDYSYIEYIKKNVLVIEHTAFLGESNIKSKAEYIGVPIGDGYVVALTHCYDAVRTVVTKIPHFGAFSRTFVAKNPSIRWEGYEVRFIGSYKDITLLKFENPGMYREAPFEFGDCSDLKVGDALFMSGWSFHKVFNFKTGYVSAFESKIGLPDIAMETYSTFVHTVPTNPGDSGSPIFCVKGGKSLIVGLVQATILGGQGVGSAIRVNFVEKTVEELIENYMEGM